MLAIDTQRLKRLTPYLFGRLNNIKLRLRQAVRNIRRCLDKLHPSDPQLEQQQMKLKS